MDKDLIQGKLATLMSLINSWEEECSWVTGHIISRPANGIRELIEEITNELNPKSHDMYLDSKVDTWFCKNCSYVTGHLDKAIEHSELKL